MRDKALGPAGGLLAADTIALMTRLCPKRRGRQANPPSIATETAANFAKFAGYDAFCIGTALRRPELGLKYNLGENSGCRLAADSASYARGSTMNCRWPVRNLAPDSA